MEKTLAAMLGAVTGAVFGATCGFIFAVMFGDPITLTFGWGWFAVLLGCMSAGAAIGLPVGFVAGCVIYEEELEKKELVRLDVLHHLRVLRTIMEAVDAVKTGQATREQLADHVIELYGAIRWSRG